MTPLVPAPIVETGNSRLRALVKNPLELAAENLPERYPEFGAVIELGLLGLMTVGVTVASAM